LSRLYIFADGLAFLLLSVAVLSITGTGASGQDQVRASADAAGHKTRRRSRPLGGYGLDPVARVAENRDGAVNPRDPPPIEAARRRVVYEERVPVDRSCGSAYPAAQL
jgi:hypothetical protein